VCRPDKWSILGEESVFEGGAHLRVLRQHIVTDTGLHVPDFYQAVLPDFVIACALALDGRVLTLWQYKNGSRCYDLTFPAGHIEPGENSQGAMRCELLEETDFEAGRAVFLSRYAVNGNQQCGFAHLFLHEGCRQVTALDCGDLESLHLRLKSVAEVDAALSDGAISILPHVSVWPWRGRILRVRAREMNEVTSTQWVSASQVLIARSVGPRLHFVGLVTYELGTIDSWREWRLQRKRFFAETVRDDLIAHVSGLDFGIFSLLVSRVAPLGCLIAIEAGAPRDDSKSSYFADGLPVCLSYFG
jgi:ADP-ribose pyrophosphatase